MNDPLSPTPNAPQVLETDGRRIAYHFTPVRSPGVMFLGGFMSDMTGTKAMALETLCRDQGQAFIRFDYTGHGESSGKFIDGTIGGWAQDALAVLDTVAKGPQILVGSSMGGWIMLLVARARPERIAGMVGIAAAPDFTEDLLGNWITADHRAALERDGICYLPNEKGEPAYPLTRALIEDGRNHLVLRGEIPLRCPVVLVQGMQDPEVPYETSIKLARRLAASDVTVMLVKNGDHRMSDPPFLEHVFAGLERVLSKIG